MMQLLFLSRLLGECPSPWSSHRVWGSSMQTWKPHLTCMSLQLGFMSGLSGEVPQSLGKMQQLGYLDIAGNMLTGSLPAVTSGNMINLRLAENFLTGTISAAYGGASVPCLIP